MSHPYMLYHLASMQIDEAQRLAARARRLASRLRSSRSEELIERSPVVATTEEVDERVPSLV